MKLSTETGLTNVSTKIWIHLLSILVVTMQKRENMLFYFVAPGVQVQNVARVP